MTASSEGQGKGVLPQRSGPESGTGDAAPSSFRKFLNTIRMKMIELPPGQFAMGSSWDEVLELRLEGELQRSEFHEKGIPTPWLDLWLKYLQNETIKTIANGSCAKLRVLISRPFAIGATEVTVGQFKMFVNETGYVTEGERNGLGSYGLDLTTGMVEQKPYYTWRSWLIENSANPSGFEQTDDHPVVCVSWNDANAFCQWLSQKDNATYRLPTEAEWEYACRAGTTTRYYCGGSSDCLRYTANVADMSLQAKWHMLIGGQEVALPPYAQAWDDLWPFTAPAGRFQPNPWGIYDMLGNGGEWCLDWYDPDWYHTQWTAGGGHPVADPVNLTNNPPLVDVNEVLPPNPDGTPHLPRPLRVVRGGVWLDPASGYRSADRENHRRHPVDSAADISFRVVRVDVTGTECPPAPIPGVTAAGGGTPIDPNGFFLSKVSEQQSNGECFIFEVIQLAGTAPIGMHVHTTEDEVCVILEGDFLLTAGDQKMYVGPGAVSYVPRNVMHDVEYVGKTRGRALFIQHPGHQQGLFTELFGVQGAPDPDKIREVARKYGTIFIGTPGTEDQVT